MDDDRLRSELDDLKRKEARIRSGLPDSEAATHTPRLNSPAMRYTLLGAEFAAIFIFFVWGGLRLDEKFATRPWLLLAGLVAGFALALYRLLFVARRLGGQ